MYAAAHCADLILCVGPESKATYSGACSVSPRHAQYFKTQQELMDALPELLRGGDTILVKASRGMHLEQTVEFLLSL